MGKALLNNRLTALLLVMLLSTAGLFLPIFYIPVSVLIAFITLGRNPQEGAILLGWAILPLIAFGIIESFSFPVFSVIMSCMLSWVLATVLYSWSSWVLVLEIASALAIAMIFLVTLFYPELISSLAVSVATFIKESPAFEQASVTASQLEKITHLSLGFMAVDIIFEQVLALMIARFWQARLFNPGGFAKEFQTLRLGKVTFLIAVVSGISAYLGLDFAMQIVPIILIAYLIAGFSLAHSLVDTYVNKVNRPFVLVFFYSTCVFFLIFCLPLIIFAAFVDSVYDFRRRFVVQ